jgi:hypothetical protein
MGKGRMMRTRIVFLSALTLAGACDSETKGSPPAGKGVARIVEDSKITVVITSEDNQSRIDEVLNGSAPKTFHWVSFEVPSAQHDALYSADGLSVDMQNSATGVRFTQVYRETCNPALEDFSPCWILETYSAGETGLAGNAHLRLSATNVYGSYEVSWQGTTDRFGSPAQYYQHNTIASVAATVVGGTQ